MPIISRARASNVLISGCLPLAPFGLSQRKSRNPVCKHGQYMPDQEASFAPASVPQKLRKGNKASLGATLAVGLIAAGAFAWWNLERPATASESAGESTLPLETFVVNLEGSGQRAYLRVGITLGLSHPVSNRKGEMPPMALVRDTILAVLATGQPEELLKVEGKRQLKDQLLKALQEKVPQMAVEDVYFTEFLVQM